MTRRTGLIIGASALAGAAIVGLVLLGISLLGEDDEGTDPLVEQLEVSAKTADSTIDLTGIAESIADGQDVAKRIQDVRDDTTNLLGRASTLEDATAARSLERANEANLDAVTALESIESDMSEGRTAVDEEQLASEEASERLAGLSSSIGGLGDPIQRAERRASGGLTELEQAIATMSAELDDSDDTSEDAESQLASVEQNLRTLDRQLRHAFAALDSSANSLSGELSDRSVELEPDVVLDCPDNTPFYRVSVRNMTCAEADALMFSADLQPSFSVGGFSCTILGDYGGPEPGVIYGASDVRCASGDQAFRYDFSE